jgi:hypothetical protein
MLSSSGADPLEGMARTVEEALNDEGWNQPPRLFSVLTEDDKPSWGTDSIRLFRIQQWPSFAKLMGDGRIDPVGVLEGMAALYRMDPAEEAKDLMRKGFYGWLLSIEGWTLKGEGAHQAEAVALLAQRLESEGIPFETHPLAVESRYVIVATPSRLLVLIHYRNQETEIWEGTMELGSGSRLVEVMKEFTTATVGIIR